MRNLIFVGMAAAILAAPVAAQENNTGGSGWQVNVYTVSSGTWSGFYDAFNPASGQPDVWEDNSLSTGWISAWDGSFNAPVQGPTYDRLTDNASYQYLFRYTFSNPLAGGSLGFTAGWDNILKGFEVSSGALPLAPSGYVIGAGPERSVDDYFGFCRNGDAMHNTGDAVCTADFVTPTASGDAWMQFEVWGDGNTDGLWVQWDQASIPQETVPEPATMTLLATGLAGMSAASARKRRKAKREKEAQAS